MTSADLFAKQDAINLFKSKRILMFGDSNMRAFYKDLIWLTKYGTLIPNVNLKIKNEISFAGDKRLSKGLLTSSRYYVEVREYTKEFFVHYEFITRIHSKALEDYVTAFKHTPDFILINSCVWDLSRWGPNGIQEYKENADKTFSLLRTKFPKTCIIFTTTLPISLRSQGGFFTDNTRFLNAILPFSIVEANNYVANCCKKYQIDVIDLHYYMQYQIDYRGGDGIHWDPIAVRYITNIILTNLCRKIGKPLPNNVPVLNNSNPVEKKEKKDKKSTGGNSEQNYYKNTYDFNTCN